MALIMVSQAVQSGSGLEDVDRLFVGVLLSATERAKSVKKWAGDTLCVAVGWC